eukprot:1995324-Rhodomonas_salina.1
MSCASASTTAFTTSSAMSSCSFSQPGYGANASGERLVTISTRRSGMSSCSSSSLINESARSHVSARRCARSSFSRFMLHRRTKKPRTSFCMTSAASLVFMAGLLDPMPSCLPKR